MRVLLYVCIGMVLITGANLAPAASGDTLYVRGNNVKVRAAPSLQAPALRQVHYGQVVIELHRRGVWVRVSLSGGQVKTGWIHASLLQIVLLGRAQSQR